MKNIPTLIFTLLFLNLYSYTFGIWDCLKSSEKTDSFSPAKSATKNNDFNAQMNAALSPAVRDFKPQLRSKTDQRLHATQKRLLKQGAKNK